MLFRNMISQYGASNVVVNGERTGFQFQFELPDSPQMSIALFEKIQVFLDDEMFEKDAVSISVDGYNFYLLSQLLDFSEIRWVYGKRAIVRVQKAGGAPTGCHKVRCVITFRGAKEPAEDSQGCRMLTFV